ncbi:hypothetical protein E2C01_043182 [Portunus trituberculatus]|uniref:Uncharacterized protein n=1 Tax=Portunus trituberculatus TaxID=210409 RepID=A0A5B7FWL2_PORTR|nr:hypothetical protein [Portunus trituberculatus]
MYESATVSVSFTDDGASGGCRAETVFGDSMEWPLRSWRMPWICGLLLLDMSPAFNTLQQYTTCGNDCNLHTQTRKFTHKRFSFSSLDNI